MLPKQDMLRLFGYAGMATSVALNLSPMPVFREIISKGEVEQFSPFVYIISFVECILWTFYALVSPNMFESMLNTIVGSCLHFVYLCLFFTYAKGKVRREFCIKLFAAILLTVFVILFTLFAAPHLLP
eukprot:c9338_g1_i3.p1 GENE.c9338_g1_i3~~c9338_g1_i3.p1  ORF type:complete len:128 (+),score=26.70 c9338_g1_i3:294-677(+)